MKARESPTQAQAQEEEQRASRLLLAVARASDFGQVVLEWEQALGPSHIRQSVSYAGYAQMLEIAGRSEEAAAAQARSREIVIAWENQR